MPSYRARLIRLVLKHWIGRKFRRAGLSIAELRKLDELMTRTQRPPAEDGTPQGPELIDSKYLKDLELDIAFLFPAFFDHPSEYLGREMVEGVDTHKLGVILPLGIHTTYFIDAESYLPMKVVADVTVDGTEYHPGRLFRDYEDQGGMMYPRTVTYWWMADEVETAVVDLVEVNVPLGEGRFSIPTGIM